MELFILVSYLYAWLAIAAHGIAAWHAPNKGLRILFLVITVIGCILVGTFTGVMIFLSDAN